MRFSNVETIFFSFFNEEISKKLSFFKLLAKNFLIKKNDFQLLIAVRKEIEAIYAEQRKLNEVRYLHF